MHRVRLLTAPVASVGIAQFQRPITCEDAVANRQSTTAETLTRFISHSVLRHSIKTGPKGLPFHIHLHQELIARLKLGASERQLLHCAAFGQGGLHVLAKPNPLNVITRENWESKVGEHCCGLHGMKAEINYPELMVYFKAEIEAHGTKATLDKHWPRLAPGLGGDILHAVIQLGYYFELLQVGHDNHDLLASGLAWCTTAYTELPGSKTKFRPLAALEGLQVQRRQFPEFRHGRDCEPTEGTPSGNTCFNNAIEDLLKDQASIDLLVKYDIDPTAGAPDEIMKEMLEVVLLEFGGKDYNDFFLLHSITGFRAMYSILTGHAWEQQTIHATLTAMWRVILFQHVARNCPHLLSTKGRFFKNIENAMLPWHEIIAFTVADGTDAHLCKLVMTLHEFSRIGWHPALCQHVAGNAVRFWQSPDSTRGFVQ